jgi:hypothetical protein
MHTLQSRYAPGDYVTITFLGLDYPGRVIGVRWSRGEVEYRVSYAVDGNINEADYSEDELEEA